MKKLDFCKHVLKNILQEYINEISSCDEFAEYARRVIIVLGKDIYNHQMLTDTINNLDKYIINCEEKRLKSEEEIFSDKDGNKCEKKLNEMNSLQLLKYFNKVEKVYSIHKRLSLLEEMLDLLDY